MIKEIIYPFDSNEFLETWNLWKEYRKEIKKTIKGKISEQAQLKKISRLSKGIEKDAIQIIHQSIENNWQGLFEIKTKKNERIDTKKATDSFKEFWSNANN